MAISITLLLIIPGIIQASDHVDGPITIKHSVADITDLFAFPSPEKPGHLVLILNSYPFVPSTGHFSDRLVYSFIIRPVSIAGMGLESSFNVSHSEYRFDCTFETPHETDNHQIKCTTPADDSIRGKVDQELHETKLGVHLFSGKRSDTFLFNTFWFGDVVFNRQIPPADSSNHLSRLNVLSIILELDMTKVFKPQDGKLFAVAGEISHRDHKNNSAKIIDRLGRPEITNTRLVATTQQEDLRDKYNQEQTFKINNSNQPLFFNRILENIDYYDSLDGHTDWQTEWKQVLANLLINDYLVIDMEKDFSSQSYFDIEYSMLRNQPHTRSGGRVPGDHVINTLMTTMINGGHAQAITDGIAVDIGIPSTTFPYLNPPSTGIISFIKGYIARKAGKSVPLKKRAEP